MKEQEKISVIIPAYNIASYIDKCVTSVFEQTYTNIEVIVVNDGSTDATGRKIKKLQQQFPTMLVIEQENRGLSAARNAGMRVATGEYIAFLDGDDYVADDYLEQLMTVIKQQDADISMTDYAVVYDRGKMELRPHFQVPKKNEACGRHKGGCLSGAGALKRLIVYKENIYARAWGKLYKRSLWQDEAFPLGKCHEDEFTVYRILHKAKRVAVVAEPLYFYVQRKGSITNSPFTIKRLHKIEAMKERMDYFAACGEKELSLVCKKHYLMQLQAGFARVWLYRKTERYRAKALLQHAYRYYRQNKCEIKKVSTVSEMWLIKLCFTCPGAYCLFMRLYEAGIGRRI